MSPGRNPAAFAGACGSVVRHGRSPGRRSVLVTAMTHWETPPTVVVALCMPMPMKAIAKITNASTMLMATPEPMMITRCHQGLL